MSKIEDTNWQIGQYHKAGNSYIVWVLSANDLLAAIGLLSKNRYVFNFESIRAGDDIPDERKALSPELMLRGFAIECLLKALWLKQGEVLCSDGKYIGVKGVGDHDLCGLSDANGLSLTTVQRDVLKRLSIYIKSAGRYPIPKNWSETKIQRLLGGGKGPPAFWGIPSDDETYESILRILYEHLEMIAEGRCHIP